MDLKCPKCSSHYLVKASLAYEVNTSEHQSLAKAAAIGSEGIGVGFGTTSGTSQTLLAQRLLPPVGRQASGCLTLVNIGIVMRLCIKFEALWRMWLTRIVSAVGLMTPLILRGYVTYKKSWRWS